MVKSYVELQEMIKTLKFNKDQRRQEVELKLENLHKFAVYLTNTSNRFIADVILTEQIKHWKEYKELNSIKVKRIIARVQQAFTSARETTLELDLVEEFKKIYENIKQICESMDQTIESIEQLISTLKTEKYNENNIIELDRTIQQAELTFQANFNEILEKMQKLGEHYQIYTKIVEKVEDDVAREMRQHRTEEEKKKIQQETPEIEKSHGLVSPWKGRSEVEADALDVKFCNIPRKPKQTKKEAYISALKLWVDDEKIISMQKIVLANYLFQQSGHHLLAKEKRYRPFCVFSPKTTSMATVQGLLAKDLSDQEKQQLLYDEKCLGRKKALKAYDNVTECHVKKMP